MKKRYFEEKAGERDAKKVKRMAIRSELRRVFFRCRLYVRAGIVAVFRYFRRVVGERACLNTLYDIYFRLFIFATHVCDQLRQYGGDSF